MSYNGTGTFQINTSGQPVVTGTVISSSAFNALTADLATGLSTAITKDGQTTTTVRIPFAQGINSSLATDSTSTTTGSIITAGGVGIAKALYVGTTANIAGTATINTLSLTNALPVASGGTGLTAVPHTVTVLSSGSGTYTLPTSCKAILIRMVGGGGGGGSASATGGGACSAGGGGASGGYVEHLIASPSATYSYAVGAAGAINGGTGGNTTFGTALLTANGGVGGANSGAGTAAFNIAPGGDGGTATGGNILNIKGSTGGFALVGGAVNQTCGGFGGMSLLGHSAGSTTDTGTAGTAGYGYGSGGSGGQTIANQSAQNGGTGASGAIIILEFYV